MSFAQEWQTEGLKTGTTTSNTTLAETGNLGGRQKYVILLYASVAATFIIQLYAEDDLAFEHRASVLAGQTQIIDLSAIPITMEDPSFMRVVNSALVIGSIQASILVDPE